VDDQRENAIITTLACTGRHHHQHAWTSVKRPLLHRIDTESLAPGQAAPKTNIAAPKHGMPPMAARQYVICRMARILLTEELQHKTGIHPIDT
jgi:hypothetical protein